jgi:hypothetical protein
MIKANRESEVRALIESLRAGDAVRREAAVARLIILGSRAIARLVPAYDAATDRHTQLDILRVLEASADERALPIARKALRSGGDPAVAAVGILRELLGRGTGPTHAEALDALLALSSDPSIERRVQAAAAEALDGASADVRQALGSGLRVTSSEALWQDASEGRIPDNPASLREAVAAHAGGAPLPVLRRIIESVRQVEEAAPAGELRAEWRSVRGAVHQALALRGSRLALYDLRETTESATEPLPPSFLAALQLVGDASCLEPLAAAFARADSSPRWRHQLTEAFNHVVKRERLTTRHSAMRRALAKAAGLAGRSPAQ